MNDVNWKEHVLKWDVFVLRHIRRCFSHICDSTQMCGLTEEVRPLVGLSCHRHFAGFLLCPSKHRYRATPFSTYSEKPGPSIAQWESTNDWIVIEEIHVICKELHIRVPLARNCIPTQTLPLRNWCRAWLVIGRSIVRATLSASHWRTYLRWLGG